MVVDTIWKSSSGSQLKDETSSSTCVQSLKNENSDRARQVSAASISAELSIDLLSRGGDSRINASNLP